MRTTFFPIQESDRTVSRQSVGSMTAFPAAGSTRVMTAAIDHHLLFRLFAIKNGLIGQDLLVLALAGNWLRTIQPSPAVSCVLVLAYVAVPVVSASRAMF